MKSHARFAAAAVAVFMTAGGALAELPPQYTSAADLRAIVNDGRIEEKLRGVVDRIELVRLGSTGCARAAVT